MNKQKTLFDNQRLTLQNAIDLTLASLDHYGQRYPHWVTAYSGGKDSTATVTLIAWAINTHQITPPKTWTILYSDTRQELPPLQQTAYQLLNTLQTQGHNTHIVTPPIPKRFYPYIIGRGVPPPKNDFRWCTPNLKIEPMLTKLHDLYDQHNQKYLMITGVRLGESAIRDQRIALSCSRDSGECGQGWFQQTTDESITDTLAPLLHWRLCHIYDWIYFEQPKHGYNVDGIAQIYGQGEVRTGCIGCNLVNRDTALERLIKQPEWQHLRPLLNLKPLFRQLRQPKNRLRKTEPEPRKDGTYAQNIQRLGPLTMTARQHALQTVLDIQTQAQVDLINPDEEHYIRNAWTTNLWPNGWTGTEITGDIPIPAKKITTDGHIVTQALLI